MEKAFGVLRWCVHEMDRRYALISLQNIRNIKSYNQKIEQAQKQANPIVDEDGELVEKMPYIVIFIDEYADLYLTEGKKIELLVDKSNFSYKSNLSAITKIHTAKT